MTREACENIGLGFSIGGSEKTKRWTRDNGVILPKEKSSQTGC